MLEIISIITSNICGSIFELLKDKYQTRKELNELEEQLNKVFSDYQEELDLEKVSVHLQRLIPQMISYCKNPNGVSLPQKVDEYVDMLPVSPNKQSSITSMVSKVLHIINNAVNSVRSHDAKSIENRQEQRHEELISDNIEIKAGIKDIRKEIREISTEIGKLDPAENLVAKIEQIADNQYGITIEAIRDAIPFATFAFACANDIDDFWLVLNGSNTCGRTVLNFEDGTYLNARTVTPMDVQVRPGFPYNFVVEYKDVLNDWCVWIKTSQSPSRYTRIPLIG